MKYLNESMLAVVVIACEKHSPAILERLNESPEGNWFVLPAVAAARVGYVPHVSSPHSGHGCAILGFVERMSMPQRLQEFKAMNDDGSLCPDCIAYEWQVIPTYTTATTRDFVCGQVVNCDDGLTENYDNELFFFCSAGCRDAFRRDPQRYIPKISPRPAVRETPEDGPAGGNTIAEPSMTATAETVQAETVQ